MRNEEITMTDDLMYNTKAGLMGALLVSGMQLTQVQCNISLLRLLCLWAQEGSALGALFPFICFCRLYQVLIGLFFARQCFSLG